MHEIDFFLMGDSNIKPGPKRVNSHWCNGARHIPDKHATRVHASKSMNELILYLGYKKAVHEVPQAYN